jgi:hypothetical protein
VNGQEKYNYALLANLRQAALVYADNLQINTPLQRSMNRHYEESLIVAAIRWATRHYTETPFDISDRLALLPYQKWNESEQKLLSAAAQYGVNVRNKKTSPENDLSLELAAEAIL